MKRPGGRPKPTSLKILEGNPGKRPINTLEPQPDSTIPKCPAWLDAEAKRQWKRLAPELARLGLLTSVDGDVLAGYCTAWSELRAATELLLKEGRTVTTAAGGIKPHPAINMQRTALAAIRAYAGLFGLDPSSRARLAVTKGQGEKDELEDFLAGS